MKKIKGTLLLAIFALTSQASADLTETVANGVWSITDRVCSGSKKDYPANDAFKLGRDSMKLYIKDGAGLLDAVIDKKTYSQYFELDQLSRIIETKTGETLIYNFAPWKYEPNIPTDHSKLIIMSSGFVGKSGTCLEGSILLTTFKKKSAK